MQKKAIFLDRDGTIIVDKIYLNDAKQIEYLPCAFEGLRAFRDMGFLFLVVTNQSGVARGLVTLDKLDEIHRIIRADFSRAGIDLANFYSAPFMTDSNHDLRKPNPGMLLEGARDYNVDLSASWMIGDRATDVTAGHRAGCRSILIRGTEDTAALKSQPEAIVADLFEAAKFVAGLK